MLKNALETYRCALAALEKAVKPTSEEVLDVLFARDTVQDLLTEKNQVSQPLLSTIVQLDVSLKKQNKQIARIIDLQEWRTTLQPPLASWWWFFESPPHPKDRFDWIWGGVSLVALTASLSFVIDISSRFLSEGTDTLGAFAITIQSVLTLLATGGLLTQNGRNGVEHFLEKISIPKAFRQEASAIFALLLLLSLFVFRSSLPKIATYYNNQGDRYFYEQDPPQITSAISSYQRALKLNPDYVDPRYGLAQIYERIQKYDRAQTEYEIAVQGGYTVAYNNLGRLYILKKNYASAVPLLLSGLDVVNNQEVTAENNLIKYKLLKNLGWARLGQKRYADAKASLQEAIDLDDRSAPGYCLMAQVLEGEKSWSQALKVWKKCLIFATSINPDEDYWVSLARQRLEKGDSKP